MAVPIGPILAGINTAANVAGTVGSFMGGGAEGLSRDDQRFLAHQQWTLSRDQFERGIQTRVADAMAAGIHPLAALGVMPASGNPIAIGEGRPRSSLGDRLNAMGQNVSRAISAYQTPEQRAMFQAQLDNERAQGDLIRAQTAESLARAANQPGSPPPAPGSMTNPQPKFVAWRNQDGSIEMAPSPEWAASNMSSPFSMYANDIKRIFTSQSTGGFPWQGAWNELKYGLKRALNPVGALRGNKGSRRR